MKKIWTAIKSFYSFKTYGDSLLTKRSAQWLLMAQIMVFIIAFTECMSWGYFGSLLGSNIYSKVIFSTLIGSFVFIVIWALDSTLMTLDRDSEVYEKVPVKDDEKNLKKFQKVLKLIKDFLKAQKFKVSATFRVGMLVLSLLITAPFLDEMIFNSQIVAQINSLAGKTISLGRDSVSNIYDKRIANYQSQLSKRQELLAKEIAGNGLSKRYGVGPVSKELSAQVAQLQKSITNEQKNKANVLNTYNTLANSKQYDNLREQFDIKVPQNSLAERSKAIKPILESTDAKRFMYAIRGFLAFIFLGLLTLKIFQPPSITIYFSEVLQSFWQRYTMGGLDRYLKVEDRFKGKSPLDAIRFWEFMRTTYKSRSQKNREDEEHDLNEENIEIVKSKIDSLKVLSDEERGRIMTVYSQLKNDFKTRSLLVSKLIIRATQLDMKLGTLSAEVLQLDEIISKLGSETLSDAENLTGNDLAVIFSMRNKDYTDQSEKRNKALKNLSEGNSEKVLLENELKLEQQSLIDLDVQIKAYEEPLLKYQTGISYLTDKQIELILKPTYNMGKSNKKSKGDDDTQEPPVLKVV